LPEEESTVDQVTSSLTNMSLRDSFLNPAVNATSLSPNSTIGNSNLLPPRPSADLGESTSAPNHEASDAQSQRTSSQGQTGRLASPGPFPIRASSSELNARRFKKAS